MVKRQRKQVPLKTWTNSQDEPFELPGSITKSVKNSLGLWAFLSSSSVIPISSLEPLNVCLR